MQSTILSEIEAFCKRTGMAESTFGRKVMGDWRLIDELRGKNRARPRRLWPETEAQIRHFIAGYTPDEKPEQADAA